MNVEGIFLANTIILQNDASGTAAATQKTPKLAWLSLLPDATTKPASSSALYDYMNTVKYTAGSATTDLDFTFSSAQDVSYCAVAGANFADKTCTFEFYTWDGVAWVKQADQSGMRNGQPVFLTFDSVSTSQVRFRFICGSSGMDIGELAAGVTIDFPRPVSVGYTPGRWNNRDQVTSNDTQSNNIGKSTTVTKGTEERVSIRNITYQWMDSNWTTFKRDGIGYPVWFSWNPTDNPTNVVYGRIITDDSRFTSSLYADVRFSIRGIV